MTTRHDDASYELLDAALGLRLALDLGRPAAARAAVAAAARAIPLCRLAAHNVAPHIDEDDGDGHGDDDDEVKR